MLICEPNHYGLSANTPRSREAMPTVDNYKASRAEDNWLNAFWLSHHPLAVLTDSSAVSARMKSEVNPFQRPGSRVRQMHPLPFEPFGESMRHTTSF